MCFQEHHVTEKNEQQSTAMNAFELISMSKGLNLENLFDTEQVSSWYHWIGEENNKWQGLVSFSELNEKVNLMKKVNKFY